MVEQHRSNERQLAAERDRAVRAYTEIEGHLNQAADLILQASRARAGNQAPQERESGAIHGTLAEAQYSDTRMPQVLLTQ